MEASVSTSQNRLENIPDSIRKKCIKRDCDSKARDYLNGHKWDSKHRVLTLLEVTIEQNRHIVTRVKDKQNSPLSNAFGLEFKESSNYDLTGYRG